MYVWKIGSSVFTEKNEVLVVILQIMISGQTDIKYEVVWWEGRERKTAWMSHLELREVNRVDDRATRIGFMN